MATNISWQTLCKQAQDYRETTIKDTQDLVGGSFEVPPELGLNVTSIPAAILTKDEVTVTELLPERLLTKLANGELTAMTVTSAFLRRAALAQQLVNCVTELMPEHALTRAQKLDDYYREHEKPVGPLHGLPVSVKEHISMKGLDCNCGFAGWVGKVADEDALILKILWDAGAVFYVRTTQPQTLMHLETSSNIYGITVNPYNRLLTSGGSSGGEGALIGLRGSCLGIGTDIGGSIRSPAANNGIFGLRPTAYRLPTKGMDHAMAGCEQLLGAIGPLSTSIFGIKTFMKTLIDAQPWLVEPSLIPLPWREDPVGFGKQKKNIRVAVIWDDEVVRPHPPILRALQEVVARMTELEVIEVVDWKPSRCNEAWEILSHLYFPDEGRAEAEAINSSGEPWRPLSNWVITDNDHVSYLDIEGVWHWTSKREEFRAEYAEIWNATAKTAKLSNGDGKAGSMSNGNCKSKDYNEMVDVILCPAGPGVAPPLDCAKYWGYTSLWNLLDYPALVFPVSTVDQEKDIPDTSYVPRNEKDKFNHGLYASPARFADAPIGLQLVCRRFEDEKVVEAYEYLQSLGVFDVE